MYKKRTKITWHFSPGTVLLNDCATLKQNLILENIMVFALVYFTFSRKKIGFSTTEPIYLFSRNVANVMPMNATVAVVPFISCTRQEQHGGHKNFWGGRGTYI
jgi:hypothetical protein